MTDPNVPPISSAGLSVLDRLRTADLSKQKARNWITSGGARVNGQTITDPDHPAAPPARITLHS